MSARESSVQSRQHSVRVLGRRWGPAKATRQSAFPTRPRTSSSGKPHCQARTQNSQWWIRGELSKTVRRSVFESISASLMAGWGVGALSIGSELIVTCCSAVVDSSLNSKNLNGCEEWKQFHTTLHFDNTKILNLWNEELERNHLSEDFSYLSVDWHHCIKIKIKKQALNQAPMQYFEKCE